MTNKKSIGTTDFHSIYADDDVKNRWGTTAANEIAEIQDRDDLSQEEKEEQYQAIITQAITESSFTIPTGRWLPLQPLFAPKKQIEPTDIIQGAVEVREYLRFDSPSSSVRVRTLFDGDTEFEVQRFEQEIIRALSPAGLKITMGLFRVAHDRGRTGYFTLDTNDFLDSLGYKRRSTGYHIANNIRQLYRTIEVLKRVKVVGEIRRHLRSGHDKVIIQEEQLVYQLSAHSEWNTEHGKPADSGEKVREGVTLLINPKIYADITERNLFSWVDKAYLAIDANRHPHVIQLIPYYVVQWREGWSKYQGVYRARLIVILRGAGIPEPKSRHWARLIDKIKAEHDFMVEQGLIKSWRIIERASKPINDLWEVVIPDGHALKVLMPGKCTEP